jgi:hypothetical protein
MGNVLMQREHPEASSVWNGVTREKMEMICWKEVFPSLLEPTPSAKLGCLDAKQWDRSDILRRS